MVWAPILKGQPFHYATVLYKKKIEKQYNTKENKAKQNNEKTKKGP
jgi:hypothetical protein